MFEIGGGKEGQRGEWRGRGGGGWRVTGWRKSERKRERGGERLLINAVDAVNT